MNLTTLAILGLHGLAMGMLYFLVASGLSLIFGLMGVLNFAHASLFAWGAYLGLTAYRYFNSFPLALAAGLLAGALLGASLEYLAVRRLYGRHLSQVLLTLGLLLVLDELLKVVYGPAILSFPRPAYLAGTVPLLERSFPVYRLFMAGAGLVVLGLVYLMLRYTRLGMVIRAGVEDRYLVQALGINVRRVFTLVFALGGGLAGLGGVVAGPFLGVYPQMGLEMQLGAFIVVVLGGMGSFAGSAAGSLLVGLAQSFGGYLFPEGAAGVNVALMALVLLLRPQGLFGGRET